MVSFWESPFDVFMHIDADAVCWGDFSAGLDWRDYDFVYNEPHEKITERIQKSQYFDPDLVRDIDPDFVLTNRDYFNSGVFIARKGIFELAEYERLLDFQQRQPDAFLCGDQGILNYLVFRAVDRGVLRARSWPFQAVVPCVDLDVLNRRFRFERGVPVILHDDRRLIHWAGPKPLALNRSPFRRPMSYFRGRYLRRRSKMLSHFAPIMLLAEEVEARTAGRHGGSYVKAVASKLRHLVRRAPQWKRKASSA